MEIFVEPFGSGGFAEIVAADLNRSGDFRATMREKSSFGRTGEKDYAAVRARGGEYLLSGRVTERGEGGGVVTFRLADAVTNEKLGAYNLNFSADARRLAAHSVGNWIVEKVAKKAGVFHTKAAYILRRGDGVNELKIADYDGHNAQVVLTTQNRLISPAWSPDGNALLYVSFERRKPVVYWQSLLTGQRRVVANFKGSNSAPAMSPDGRTVAAALTVHGGVQQVYLLTENARRRLRESGGIDTEPDFSPDGGRLLLTSDEAGTPQIYEFDLEESKARRLTYGAPYAASARYSGDGAAMTYIVRDGAGQHIALMDLASGASALLTGAGSADSPSFSANDAMVMFVDENRANRLHTVSVNGKIRGNSDIAERGTVIDPVWGPLSSDWF